MIKILKKLLQMLQNYSEVEIHTGDEYYRTYADEFGADIVDNDKSYFNDYGQLWNTRQFFKYDFSPELTKSLTADTYKNKLKEKEELDMATNVQTDVMYFKDDVGKNYIEKNLLYTCGRTRCINKR